MVVLKGKRPNRDEMSRVVRGTNGPFCFEGDLTARGRRRLGIETLGQQVSNWIKHTIQRWMLLVFALLVATSVIMR